MSIAWATVIVVALLLPGFAFLAGLYVPERVTRESTPISPLGQLAIVVGISLIAHGVLYAAINRGLSCDEDEIVACVAVDRFIPFLRVDGTLSNAISLPDMRTMLDRHILHILGYFIAAALIGFCPGLSVGIAISYGFLANLMPHRWMNLLTEARRYDAAGDSDRKNEVRLRATVLSKTLAGRSVVIYEGTVIDFFAKADGTINLMVLRNAKRGVLSVNDKKVAEPSLYTKLASNETLEDKLLILTSADVANMYFEKEVVEFTQEQEDRLAGHLRDSQVALSPSGPTMSRS